MNSKMKKAAAVAAILGLALTAGISVALWTSSGTGSGRARTLTAQTITVNAATGSADLYPGFSGGDLHFTMTNPNPYGVVFTSMAPGAVTSSDPTNCPASNLTVVAGQQPEPAGGRERHLRRLHDRQRGHPGHLGARRLPGRVVRRRRDAHGLAGLRPA